MEDIIYNKERIHPNIKLFLWFMGSDSRIKDADNWSHSIRNKADAVHLRYSETLEQITRCHEEIQILNKDLRDNGKADSATECSKLVVKYEDFINSVYSLCENLSRVIIYLYPRKNLPHNFSAQKLKFLESDIDQEYANILRKTEWYDEVHSIRSESIHFLTGSITTNDNSELGYYNDPKNPRKGTPNDISIYNIKDHVETTFEGLWDFLIAFGDYFINLLDPYSRISHPCIRTSSGYMGVEEIYLKEYLNGSPGRCLTPSVECRRRDSCQARKK